MPQTPHPSTAVTDIASLLSRMASSLLSHYSPSRGRSRHTYLSLSVISSLLKAVIVPGEERGGGGSSKGDNLGVRDECSSEDDGGAEAARVKVKEIAVPWKPQMRIKLSTYFT